MKYRLPLIAAIFLLLAVIWIFDRSRLQSEITELEGDIATQESLQDVAEYKLFRELTPGQTVESQPGIQALADDIVRPGHPGYEYCCTFLAEQFPDTSESFHDCETYVFNVSLDAVPFHGGSYWIVTRDDRILLVFQYEATIGG